MPGIFSNNYRSVDFGPASDGSRWFGHDLSGVLDSGIGQTQDTFRPTIPQPVGRKRRAGDQLGLGPGIERPVRREGAPWGTPCKRALFRSDGQNSISSGREVPEGRSGWPPDGDQVSRGGPG